MAKRRQAAAEAIHVTPTEEAAPPVAATATLDPASEGGQSTAERQTARFPDPREQKSVSLGADRGSPRLRLLRSHRFNQLQIRCDEGTPRGLPRAVEGCRLDRTPRGGNLDQAATPGEVRG